MQGSYILQIDDWIDVGNSIDEQQRNENSNFHRLLKLLLTDGKQNVILSILNVIFFMKLFISDEGRWS